MSKHGDSVFEIGLIQKTARTEYRRSSIAQHIFRYIAHIVIAVELLVHKRHALLADIGRERQLEFRQAFVTETAAKTDNRRLADCRFFGNLRHRRMHEPFGFCQRAFGYFALCTGQTGQRFTDLA